MSEREYIVSLNRGVDYDAFWDQIENVSADDGFVPTRRVNIENERPGSLRSCHYLLTDDEAKTLREDARVYSVEIPPEQRDDIEIGFTSQEIANFNKTAIDTGNYRDWGKIRHSFSVQPYIGDTTSSNFPYIFDGTGVDVVIQDSGLQVDHPEFLDANGVSRVQQIDWPTESGLPFTQSANHYRDWDGHGTHVAGTAGGKNFGWAKNARIYSVKLAGLEGPGDSGTGISTTYAFDCIKLWHRNKPVDPVTGYKRPTIVNMSWGYSAGYGDRPDGVSDLVYRGTTYNLGNDTNFNNTAHRTSTYGFYPYFTSSGYRYPVRIGSIDADVQELIDEGIHVCIAAGNNSFKIDVPGGDDYDNIVFSSGGTGYYHRGSSPYDDQAFMVGCLSATTASPEQKVSFSSNGPGVDIYAAGHNIISASSNINRIGGVTYFDNPSFKQINISGTSMASPQVCGLGAIYLQANPDWSPAQLRDRLHKDSVSTLEDGGLTDYADTSQISGGPNRLMVSRYGVVSPFNSNLYALGKKR